MFTCYFFKLTADQVLALDWISASSQVNLLSSTAPLLNFATSNNLVNSVPYPAPETISFQSQSADVCNSEATC